MQYQRGDCVFCLRVLNGEFDPTDQYGVARFEPLNPVRPGHMLFIPMGHCADATDETWSGPVLKAASSYVRSEGIQANIITSIGADATQTVFHFHMHVVPRRENDGLILPWTNQKRH